MISEELLTRPGDIELGGFRHAGRETIEATFEAVARWGRLFHTKFSDRH